MIRKIRISLWILLFCALCMWQTKTVQADIITGKCGENITYSFDTVTKTLIIEGRGTTYDYGSIYDEKNNELIDFREFPFQELLVEKAIIKEGITRIGNNFFNSCWNLNSVAIPNSVTRIGDGAFSACVSLKTIIIPNDVIEIGNWAFQHCYSLNSITLPKGIKKVNCGMFSTCKALKSIRIPKGVNSIENEAFKGCELLTNVAIPDSVTRIGNSAFSSCASLKSISIPSSVKKIECCAFSTCQQLSKVVIKNKKTSIKYCSFGYRAFSYVNMHACKTNPILVLYGYKDSTTQKHANKYKIGFQTIGEKQAGRTKWISFLSVKNRFQFQAKWNRISKAYKYEVQLYNEDKVRKGEEGYYRSYTKVNSIKAKKIKGLTKGQTYNVRVRAYAKRNGKQIIGPWSNVKKVKVK